MNFKNALLATTLVAVSALMSPAVSAAPFDITNVGNWTAIVGGASVTGLNTPNIKWGTPQNPTNEKSGYDWDPIPVTGIADLTSTPFVIGRFTHNNLTIGAGQSPTSVTLSLNVSIEDTGIPATVATPNFSFIFAHNETDNLIGSPAGTTCPATGELVPLVGCPDIVSLPNLFADQLVDLGPDGIKTMQVLGFLLDNANDGIYDPLIDTTLVSEFITTESQVNYAFLLVQFSDPPQVPEPASIGLLGLGVLGLGWMGYRRRKSA